MIVLFLAYFFVNAGVYATKIYAGFSEYERPGILRTSSGQFAYAIVQLFSLVGMVWLYYWTVVSFGWLYLLGLSVLSAIVWTFFVSFMKRLVGLYFVALAPTVTLVVSSAGLVICDLLLYYSVF